MRPEVYKRIIKAKRARKQVKKLQKRRLEQSKKGDKHENRK